MDLLRIKIFWKIRTRVSNPFSFSYGAKIYKASFLEIKSSDLWLNSLCFKQDYLENTGNMDFRELIFWLLSLLKHIDMLGLNVGDSQAVHIGKERERGDAFTFWLLVLIDQFFVLHLSRALFFFLVEIELKKLSTQLSLNKGRHWDQLNC